MGFIDILIPPTFPDKGAVSFEPGQKGASRGLTESILDIEKRKDGGRWIKIPIFNGEEEWGELSGGTSLGIITPWEGEGHFHDSKGQKRGGGGELVLSSDLCNLWKFTGYSCRNEIPV